MKIFYLLHNNNDINSIIDYSFYVNGYIDNLLELSKLNELNKINFCKLANSTNIENNYYPLFIKNDNIITNSIDLSKNLIFTGPNASGKTTIIKSLLINVILSQQFGMGCYSKANIKLVDKFYCYLNIPDTNDRDSLFQAEARICKEIIENINENQDQNCLCIFDELYSGTNPEEAVNSSFGLLSYIGNKNCKYILTTHFNKLCKMLNKKHNVENFKMKVNEIDNDINFTYKIEKGISKIKGASNVLKKLNYPDKIIEDINKLNKKEQ